MKLPIIENIESLSSNYTVEIDRLNKEEWSNIINQFSDASIYQSWSYGAIRWRTDNLIHILIRKDEEITAAAQVRIIKFPFVKGGIAYLPWGPMWKAKTGDNDKNNLILILKSLDDYLVKKNKFYLRISPNIVLEQDNDVAQIFEDLNYKKNKELPTNRSFLVDLSPDLETIRKNLVGKWRNQLNRSEKNNLEVVEGINNEMFDIFLSLANEMLERKKFIPGVDYNEFKEIQKDLPSKQKMKIIVCKENNIPVSCSVITALGDKGIYILGATSNAGMKSKGSYLCQWKAIEWLKSYGCRWYDLGGINPEKNPGVHKFKRGIGGREIYHIGIFEKCENRLSSMIVNGGSFFKKLINNYRSGGFFKKT